MLSSVLVSLSSLALTLLPPPKSPFVLAMSMSCLQCLSHVSYASFVVENFGMIRRCSTTSWWASSMARPMRQCPRTAVAAAETETATAA